MDAETLRYFSSMGVGGALGGFIFYFYRRDVIGRAEQLLQVVKENTEAITALKAVIERDHR